MRVRRWRLAPDKFTLSLFILLVQYIVFTGAALSKDIVINEFDLNPAGKDVGNEWVVLYNPTEVEVDIGSWILETTHGKMVVARIPNGTIMPPKGYWTYIHKGQWLDNEDESITLRDAEDVEVDRTLMASDRDDDNRYWTRHPDGLDTNSDSDWRFGERALPKGVIRSGIVKHVEDGDTIDVVFPPENKDIRGIQRIRLVGIDAPELDTAEGRKVKEVVEKMCLGKVVEFEVDDERHYDKYYRILAVLYIDGLNLNVYLLRERYARPLVILPSEFIPYASFIYSPEEPAAGQMITFDASPSYSLDPDAVIISYKWDFGDGTDGEGKVVNHSYSSSGDYTVDLTVVDSDGRMTRENTQFAKIVIKSPPHTISLQTEAILRKDGFVVIPSQEFKDVTAIYEDCKRRGIPIFLTTDVLLHITHILLDYTWRIVEIEKLRPFFRA